MGERADMWAEVLENQAKLTRCATEYRHKIRLVSHFFDEHLGTEWRSPRNILGGIEFEVALLELEKKLATPPKRGGHLLS